jgi:hypothetical protein
MTTPTTTSRVSSTWPDGFNTTDTAVYSCLHPLQQQPTTPGIQLVTHHAELPAVLHPQTVYLVMYPDLPSLYSGLSHVSSSSTSWSVKPLRDYHVCLYHSNGLVVAATNSLLSALMPYLRHLTHHDLDPLVLKAQTIRLAEEVVALQAAMASLKHTVSDTENRQKRSIWKRIGREGQRCINRMRGKRP